MQRVFHIYPGKINVKQRNALLSIEIEQNGLLNVPFSVFRSTMLPSATEQKELNELEEPLGTSPPLELRRPITGQRVAVPHSLQSPQDRATGKYETQFI